MKTIFKTSLTVVSLAMILGACVSTQQKVVQVSEDGKEIAVQLSTSDKSLLSQCPTEIAKEALTAIEPRAATSLSLMNSVAELNILAGQVNEAEKKARSILKRDIKNIGAAKTLIKVAILRKKFEEAKLIAANTLQFDERNVEVLALKGLAYYSTGDLIEARELWKKGLQIDPQHIPSQMNLGALYYQNRNLALADGMFERVLKISPKYGDASVGHALVLSAQGRAQDAKNILMALHENNKESPLILFNLAVIEKERFSNYEASAKYLAQYLSVQGNERALVERALFLREEVKSRLAAQGKEALSDKDLRTMADKSSQAVNDQVEAKEEPARTASAEPAAVQKAPEAPKAEPKPAVVKKAKDENAPKDYLKDDVRSLEEDLR